MHCMQNDTLFVIVQAPLDLTVFSLGGLPPDLSMTPLLCVTTPLSEWCWASLHIQMYGHTLLYSPAAPILLPLMAATGHGIAFYVVWLCVWNHHIGNGDGVVHLFQHCCLLVLWKKHALLEVCLGSVSCLCGKSTRSGCPSGLSLSYPPNRFVFMLWHRWAKSFMLIPYGAFRLPLDYVCVYFCCH